MEAKQNVLCISWVFCIINDSFLAECAYKALSPYLQERIWICNLTVKTVKNMYDTSKFWPEVLLARARINYSDPQCRSQMLNQVIWYNSNICVNGKPILWTNWYDKGIVKMSDLIDSDGAMITHRDLGVSWFEWVKIRAVILVIWKLWMSDIEDGTELAEPAASLYDRLLTKGKQKNKMIYDLLIDDNDKALLKYFQ